MKKVIFSSAMMLIALVAMAKDIKTVVVTTQPQMHCENCEKKIKGNLRFEKGVKEIQCGKSGYQATEIKTEKPAQKKDSGKKNE